MVFVTLFFLPVFYGKESYKEWLLYELNKYTNLIIDYSDSDLIFFPYPGIRLKNVSIFENFSIKPYLSASSTSFLFSWKSIYKNEIIFSRIHISGANFTVRRFPNDKLEIDASTIVNSSQDDSIKFTKTPEYLYKIAEAMDLESLELTRSRILFLDKKHRAEYVFFVNNANLTKENNSINLDYEGAINDKESILNINAKLKLPEFAINKLTECDITIQVENFPAFLVIDALKYSSKTNYRDTKIDGNFEITKKTGSKFADIAITSKIEGLALKNGRKFSPMQYNANYRFNFETNSLHINRYSMNWPSHGKFFGSGVIHFQPELPMTFYINSSYADFHSSLDLLQIFRLDLQESKNELGQNISKISRRKKEKLPRKFHLWLKNVYAYDNKFDLVTGQVEYYDPIMMFNNYKLHIYNGLINGNGTLDFRDFKFRYTAEFENIDTPALIKNYTEEEYISGKIQGKIKLITSALSEEVFFNKMKAKGYFFVRDGELLGYANITKAIAVFGKYMNLLGPSGKSTAFQYIKSDFAINHKKVHLLNLKMKGVGIDAEAKGNIGFDSSINMRVSMSLAGPIGTVLKVPVIYGGNISKDEPYVDPVWVTSVAIGSTVAFPGNPVPGVMVGSFVSDYFRDFMELFSSNKHKNLNEIDKPIQEIH
ncbi:MAG: hypothetical protein OEZ34_10550 [Spirochaetia bacterium]|nr:hypothetical protein [Spirochaetia bacterium]